MRFVTADAGMMGPLRFSDLALFGLAARYAVQPRIELNLGVDLLPKQPSYTEEKVWQSVSGGLRVGLGARTALAASAAGGHLLGHVGAWYRESLAVEYRKPIHEVLAFDLHAGVDAISLAAPGAQGGYVGEAAAQASALFHSPEGVWGGWIGLGYAIPVAHGGSDPTTGMSLDPRPRVDLHLGSVLALVEEWDLFVDLAIVDRGDAANPATRLPILDGGFDQRQLIFGVTRHVGGHPSSSRDE
jgi:hypothetical protein